MPPKGDKRQKRQPDERKHQKESPAGDARSEKKKSEKKKNKEERRRFKRAYFAVGRVPDAYAQHAPFITVPLVNAEYHHGHAVAATARKLALAYVLAGNAVRDPEGLFHFRRVQGGETRVTPLRTMLVVCAFQDAHRIAQLVVPSEPDSKGNYQQEYGALFCHSTNPILDTVGDPVRLRNLHDSVAKAGIKGAYATPSMCGCNPLIEECKHFDERHAEAQAKQPEKRIERTGLINDVYHFGPDDVCNIMHRQNLSSLYYVLHDCDTPLGELRLAEIQWSRRDGQLHFRAGDVTYSTPDMRWIFDNAAYHREGLEGICWEVVRRDSYTATAIVLFVRDDVDRPSGLTHRPTPMTKAGPYIVTPAGSSCVLMEGNGLPAGGVQMPRDYSLMASKLAAHPNDATMTRRAQALIEENVGGLSAHTRAQALEYGPAVLVTLSTEYGVKTAKATRPLDHRRGMGGWMDRLSESWQRRNWSATARKLNDHETPSRASWVPIGAAGAALCVYGVTQISGAQFGSALRSVFDALLSCCTSLLTWAAHGLVNFGKGLLKRVEPMSLAVTNPDLGRAFAVGCLSPVVEECLKRIPFGDHAINYPVVAAMSVVEAATKLPSKAEFAIDLGFRFVIHTAFASLPIYWGVAAHMAWNLSSLLVKRRLMCCHPEPMPRTADRCKADRKDVEYQDVRPGSWIDIRNRSPCRPKVGTVDFVVTPSPYVVWRQCAHNAEVALINRVLRPLPWQASLEQERLWALAFERFRSYPIGLQVTEEEWIATSDFNEPKRELYRAALRGWIQSRKWLVMKMFVKREPSLYSKDPRAIQEWPKAICARVAPYVREWDKVLKRHMNWRYRVTYASAMTPEQISGWLVEAENSVRPFLAQGDDLIYFSLDIWRKDLCTQAAQTFGMLEHMARCGVPRSALNDIRLLATKARGRFTSNSGMIRYAKDFGTASGWAGTTAGNSAELGAAFELFLDVECTEEEATSIRIVLGGDDSAGVATWDPVPRLKAFFDLLHLRLEGEATKHRYHLEFFSRWFCPVEPYLVVMPGQFGPDIAVVADTVLSAKVGRLLARFGRHVGDLPRSKERGWLANLLPGAVIDYGHLPVIRSVVSHLCDCVSNVNAWADVREDQRYKLHNEQRHETNTSTHAAFLARYAITAWEVEQSEALILREERVLPLDIRHVTLVETLIRADVGLTYLDVPPALDEL